MDSSTQIDLNADLGEGCGNDEALLGLVSSANIACGWHAGDAKTMRQCVRWALANGVAIGAHPSFPDRENFGRSTMNLPPEEIVAGTLYQIGALAAIVKAEGGTLAHVKAHGALYNVANKNAAVAEAIVAAVKTYDPSLLIFALPGSALQAAADAAGLPVAREGFADRAYNADGSLVSRRLPGAMITDAAAAAGRMLRVVAEGRLTAVDGAEIDLEIDTICVHSDTPDAVAIAHAIRERFEEAGMHIRSLRP